jgi:hypothetical protein
MMAHSYGWLYVQIYGNPYVPVMTLAPNLHMEHTNACFRMACIKMIQFHINHVQMHSQRCACHINKLYMYGTFLIIDHTCGA